VVVEIETTLQNLAEDALTNLENLYANAAEMAERFQDEFIDICLAGWFECALSCLKMSNGLLPTDMIANLLVQLVAMWSKIAASDRCQRSSTVARQFQNKGAECLTLLKVLHREHQFPSAAMGEIQTLVEAGLQTIPLDAHGVSGTISPVRTSSSELTSLLRTSSRERVGSSGLRTPSADGAFGMLEPSLGLPLVRAIAAIPAIDPDRTYARHSVEHKHRQLAIDTGDVLELLYDDKGLLITIDWSALCGPTAPQPNTSYDIASSLPKYACLARRFGSNGVQGSGSARDESVLVMPSDDDVGTGYVPAIDGAFEMVAPTLSTIEWTLASGWYMSQHTNESHLKKGGAKSRPHQSTSRFVRKAIVADEEDGQCLSTPLSPASPSYGGLVGGGGPASPFARAGSFGRQDDDWIIGNKLGSGTFGDVFRCGNTKNRGEVLACKILNVTNPERRAAALADLQTEFTLMKHVPGECDRDHPYVARFPIEVYTRGCHWFQHLLASRVTNGIALGWPFSYRFTL
jgi:hypothetical protein